MATTLPNRRYDWRVEIHLPEVSDVNTDSWNGEDPWNYVLERDEPVVAGGLIVFHSVDRIVRLYSLGYGRYREV